MEDRRPRHFRREFAPVADFGEVVVLRESTGACLADKSTGNIFWSVTHVEGIPLVGPHGVDVIWCATAGPASPYQMDGNAVAGVHSGATIAAGGTLPTLTPAWANLADRQFMQVRTLVRPVPDSNNANITLDDWDVLWFAGSAQPRFATGAVTGVVNAIAQYSLGGDAEPMPAKGSNIATQSNTQNDPFESPTAVRSQLFCYGSSAQNAGNIGVSLKNNGSAASAGAIGLQVSGYVFNVTGIPTGSNPKKRFWAGMKDVMVPDDVDLSSVIVIPIQGQTTPGPAGGAAPGSA